MILGLFEQLKLSQLVKKFPAFMEL